MAKISLTFFSTPSQEGLALRDEFIEIAEREFHFTTRTKIGATQVEFATACMNNDLVVFDATIEVDGQHNYVAATLQPGVLDHVLVVSRTYLPINLYCFRQGGAPDYPNPYTGSSGTFTNADIITWLRKQIEDLRPSLPRRWYQKGVGSVLAMRTSAHTQSEQNTQIFVSYRSSDLVSRDVSSNEQDTDSDDLEYKNVKAVTEKLTQMQKAAFEGVFPSARRGTVVRAIFPGQLAYRNEVLSEYRRWQVLTIIDTQWISETNEVWICDTEHYLDSWWTQGELISLSWRFSDRPNCPKIRLFHPETNTLTDLPADFLPPMTKEQRQRLTRIMSVADPRTTSPEYIHALRGNTKFPAAGQLPYTSGHQWSDDFWLNPLLPCSCQKERVRNIRTAAGVEAFLQIAYEPRMTPEEWEDCIRQGTVMCRSCGAIYTIKEVPPRYLWMPTRRGQITGPNGTSLVKFPTHRIIRT